MRVKIGKFRGKNPPRKIKVRIDRDDLYNLDSTLANVILPALVEFRKDIKACPYVEDSDIPESILKESSDNHDLIRWEFILDSMIRAFSLILEDPECSTAETAAEVDSAIESGLTYFAKYFRSLRY